MGGQNEPLGLIATMTHIPENASSTHLLTLIPNVLNPTKKESWSWRFEDERDPTSLMSNLVAWVIATFKVEIREGNP